MDPQLEARIREALRDPKNMGELEDADAIGTVGNSECGEMLRLWIKYKQDRGREVIDQATFQSFGCETAIAVASLATQMLRGKTREEAMSLNSEALSSELGPLPPMKIHCAELVEGALRSALNSDPEKSSAPASTPDPKAAPSLIDTVRSAGSHDSGVRVVLLEDDPSTTSPDEGTDPKA